MTSPAGDRPLVSIVTPTLNGARFLEATLRSVREQTYPRVEHIVVDGGSTDGSLDLLRAEGEQGTIRWISEPDEGMYEAINKGMALAGGEILAYLAGDDAYLPWALESVVRIFESQPGVDIVFGDGTKIEHETGVQRLRLFPPFDRPSLARYESLMQPAVFWRRSMFERIGGFDPKMRYVADLDYWLRAGAATAKFAHLREVIAVERIHAGRLSSAQSAAMAAEDRAMRAAHAAADGGTTDREQAVARDMKWQRRLFLWFLVASWVRPLPGPWHRFLNQGRVIVNRQRLLRGSKPHESKYLRNAVVSRLAADVITVGVPTEEELAPQASAHGHGLLQQLLPDVAERARRPGTVIEIGTTREKLPGQGSTVILAGLAARLGLPFMTVDMDPANTEQALADLAGIPGARAVTAKGEDFIATIDQPILAAYLDAFDIQHGQHSEYRIDRYRQFLGTEITNEAAAQMHLACAEALVPRLMPGGLIVIDDTWMEGERFAGKGGTAVPALLRRRFKIVAQTRTAVALQAPRRRPRGMTRIRRGVVRRARRYGGAGLRAARRLGRRARRLGRRVLASFRSQRNELALALAYRFSADGRRSSKALRAMRDTAKGRRCVIIGNGPSLNEMDLAPLKDEVTFGLNRGHLLFPRIGGPTTYLVSVNRLVIEQSGAEMIATPCLKFFDWRNRALVPKGLEDVIFLRTIPQPGFSTDIPGRGLWEGATVTYVAMQLAYHLGYREVALIGVDHSFATTGPAHAKVTSTGPDPNHFDPSYFGEGYRWQLPDLEMSEQAYTMARAAFEAAGGMVIDATVGGKLTIFEKADFTTLFPPKRP